MELIVKVDDPSIAKKIIEFLELFRSEGVRVEPRKEKKDEKVWIREYIQEHWKEIGMNTHSADLDDDERMYEAAARFYHEKHSY
jgi:hypothetical protein